MTISVVLADANILFSRTLRDYFLYAADAGAIEIHWSQQILDEMSRNVRKRLGLTHADTARLDKLLLRLKSAVQHWMFGFMWWLG